MKNIIILVTLFLGLTSFAQQQDQLTIYNFTDCAFEYTLFAYTDGEDCTDPNQKVSPLIIDPQSSTIISTYNIYPDFISSVDWYTNNGVTSFPDTVLARFVGFKTTDGSGISIGSVACGAAQNTDISACDGQMVTATFQGFGTTKIVVLSTN